MRMPSRLFLCALLLFSAAANAGPLTGGNALISRDIVDSRSNFTVLDRNNTISGSGQLTEWQVFAANDGPVALMVFRSTGTNTYSLVGSSALETPTANAVNTFALSAPIGVQAGDAIGLYFGSPSSVPFTLDPPGRFNFGSDLSGTVLFSADQSGKSTQFLGSSNRTYSVAVNGVPEPATGALAGLALVAAVALRRRRTP